MQIVWNEEIKEVLERVCAYAHKYRVDVTITFGADRDAAELRVEPTYWDKDESQTQLTARCLNCNNAKACKENNWQSCRFEPIEDEPQKDYPCNTCANKGDHDGKCKNCVADSEPIRLKTPSNYEPKQTDCAWK